DLKLHQPIEEAVIVPMRGAVRLSKALQKVAARITITALPVGTSIWVDGQVLGKDRVDRGIQPGSHTIRLTAENFKAFEETVQGKPDDQLILEKPLEPVAGTGAIIITPPSRESGVVVIRAPPQQPPPPPMSTTDELYERKSYFYVGFDYDELKGPFLL